MRGTWRRRSGLLLTVVGAATLAWTVTVWQWRDPLSSLCTMLEQRELEARYESLPSAELAAGDTVAETARAFRRGVDKAIRSAVCAFRASTSTSSS